MSINKALKRLGYTREWLDYGIITTEYLIAQHLEIESSEDQNAEHYRCGAFEDFLKSKAALTETDIVNIFKLKDDGPDLCDLHIDRIHSLIYSGILNDNQLLSLNSYPEVTEAPLQKLYNRECLIRKINELGIEACFCDIKQSNDPNIHKYILNLPELELNHINWLSKNSTNKKVRNIATQLSNSKKYRTSAT